jgi:hypothetical protein
MFQQAQYFVILDLMAGGPGWPHQIFVIRQAASMSQQMADGDGSPICWKFGENVGDWLVVTQFAVANQQHDGHGGELLGEGSQAKIGF